MKNVKFSKILTLIINGLSNGKVQVGYTIENGVIVVTTADDLAGNTFTRVYDIRDLAARPGEGTRAVARQEAIVKMITQTIDSKSWHENGGETGNIRWPARKPDRHPIQRKPSGGARKPDRTPSCRCEQRPNAHYESRLPPDPAAVVVAQE